MAVERVIDMTESELIAEIQRQISAVGGTWEANPTSRHKIMECIRQRFDETKTVVSLREIVDYVGSPPGTISSGIHALKMQGKVIGNAQLGYVPKVTSEP